MSRAFFTRLEPSPGLSDRILERIASERRAAARLRLVGFGAVLAISVFALVPVLQYASSEFYASGFYDYASLSVDALVRGYASDLLYSLATSLPSLALLLLIAAAGVLWWSMARTARYARIAFAPAVA